MDAEDCYPGHDTADVSDAASCSDSYPGCGHAEAEGMGSCAQSVGTSLTSHSSMGSLSSFPQNFNPTHNRTPTPSNPGNAGADKMDCTLYSHSYSSRNASPPTLLDLSDPTPQVSPPHLRIQ